MKKVIAAITIAGVSALGATAASAQDSGPSTAERCELAADGLAHIEARIALAQDWLATLEARLPDATGRTAERLGRAVERQTSRIERMEGRLVKAQEWVATNCDAA
jgi:hypothetical protein